MDHNLEQRRAPGDVRGEARAMRVKDTIARTQ